MNRPEVDVAAHGAFCPAKKVPVRPSSFRGRVKWYLMASRRRWRRASARFRVLPDFVIVGAQKAGTTSLYAYLEAHPNVLSAAEKEVHFFDTCDWDAGPDAYRSNFPLKVHMWLAARLRRATVITGEATPYYLYHPLVAERLAAAVPHAKIIILLRNPVDRALSHYGHEVRKKRETLPVGDAMLAEADRLSGHEAGLAAGEPSCRHMEHRHFSYQDRSRYTRQVARYLDAFPADQVLVLKSEKLFEDDADSKARLAEFLGLPGLTRPFIAKGVNPSRTRNAEVDATRRMLADVLAEDEKALRDLLGDEFHWQASVAVDGEAS